MTVSRLADLNAYRRHKSRMRVFEAMKDLYTEILARLEDDTEPIDPDEFEAFIIQVLGDHLMGHGTSIQDFKMLDENYRRFDQRLRRCLQTRLLALEQFDSVGNRQARPR